MGDAPASATSGSARGVLATILASVLLAAVLFFPKNLGVVKGVLAPPAGYVGSPINLGSDNIQYLTWLSGMQKQFFITNYHLPYQSAPALFNPVVFAVAQMAAALRMDPAWAVYLAQFLMYVAASFAWLFAIGVFTETRMEARMALLVSLCSVPLISLVLLPAIVIGHPIAAGLPGLGLLVGQTTDGFLHGFPGSFLVTFGTATTVLAFAFLARYARAGKPRDLVLACFTTFVSAIGHPFEVVVIVLGGAGGLILIRKSGIKRAFLDSSALALAGGLGILPYVVQTLRHPWMRQAASLNVWQAPAPHQLIAMLGLPTIAAMILLAFRPRMRAASDRLLQAWFVATLVGLYLPGVPWAQHLLDGYFCCVGLLLVRQVAGSGLLPAGNLQRRLLGAAAVILLAFSLAPYVMASYRNYLDGNMLRPARFTPTLLSVDHKNAIRWLRQNTEPEGVILAPPSIGGLYATVPLHSVASHYVFSLSFAEQRDFVAAFYEGTLAPEMALQHLQRYGVRYVVLPDGSPAQNYIASARLRAQFGEVSIFEFSQNTIQPIPDSLLRRN